MRDRGNSLRGLGLGLLLVATLGTACAPAWTPITEQSQRPFTYPQLQVTFNLPIGWMTSYYAPALGYIFFTVHGAELEEIWVRRFPKSAIVKGTNRNTAGQLTVQDMAKISVDSRRTDEGVGAFQLVSNKPAKVDGKSCFRLDYRYRNAIGLQKRTVEYGCPVGSWLYRIEFNAPTQHYFDRYLSDFESMAKSMQFLVLRGRRLDRVQQWLRHIAPGVPVDVDQSPRLGPLTAIGEKPAGITVAIGQGEVHGLRQS